jgi:hypothetical protein
MLALSADRSDKPGFLIVLTFVGYNKIKYILYLLALQVPTYNNTLLFLDFNKTVLTC